MLSLAPLSISLVSIITPVCLVHNVVSFEWHWRVFLVIGYHYHNGDNQHWTFNWTGHSWTIRSVSSGQYLGVESANYSDGDKIVTVPSPFDWDIWHDEVNPNAFRWVLFSAFPPTGCILWWAFVDFLIFWYVSKSVLCLCIYIWLDNPVVNKYWSKSFFSFFIHNTHYNIDLNNWGATTPGEPITLWWTWEGVHQTWKVESRELYPL